MATTSALFTELYAPGLRNTIFENYTYLPVEYDMWLNSGSSVRQYEEDYRLGGFGNVPTKPEGTSITYDDPVADTTVRYVWTAFGKGFRATHESMVDELYGVMNGMAASLGKSFRNQTELQGVTILDNAFVPGGAGVNNSGFDPAIALCGTHTLLRGGTYANFGTTGALSVTLLQDAMIAWERQVDESGVPISIRPMKLIIAPENIPNARELLGSAFLPGQPTSITATDANAPMVANRINVLSGTLDIVVSHHMANTDDWFIQAAPGDHDMWFIWREKFQTDAADDFDTGDGKIKGYMRFGVGYGDYRGFWGSEGS